MSDLSKMPLLTLKGQVSVHFMDNETLDGELIAQDPLNIFLRVDDAPLMIPRTQIRYIKGQSEQTVQQDDLRASSEDDTPTGATPAVRGAAISPAAQEVSSPDTEETDEGTLFVRPDEEGEDATAFLGTEEDTDDTTLFIEEDEDEDSTLVLDEEQEVSPPVTIAYLECTSGPHEGERFELGPGVTTLGRSNDNMIALSGDKEVSRRHARITSQSDDSFVIEDRGSLNGVIINDGRIEAPFTLRDGDEVLLGVSKFIFHQE